MEKAPRKRTINNRFKNTGVENYPYSGLNIRKNFSLPDRPATYVIRESLSRKIRPFSNLPTKKTTTRNLRRFSDFCTRNNNNGSITTFEPELKSVRTNHLVFIPVLFEFCILNYLA